MPSILRAVLLVLAASSPFMDSGLIAQDAPAEEEIPLHEREPFDLITLNEANGFAKIEVYPLENRDSKTLRIRRIEDPPDRLFDVDQRHIDKIESFDELLLSRALGLVNERKADEAFPYIERLQRQFPRTPSLAQLVEKFFVVDAGLLFAAGRYDEALLSLDEVYSRNPGRAGLDGLLRRVVGQVIRSQFEQRNYQACRRTAQYANERYGSETKTIVDSWADRLKAKATEQLELARRLHQDEDAVSALAAVRAAEEIWPETPGVDALSKAILAKYPRVTVAVTQPYVADVPFDQRGPDSLNWAARRVGPLVRQHLVEFVEFTADGGQYQSPVGQLTVSSDRRHVTLRITKPDASDNVGYEVARALLRLADPVDPTFNRRWSEFNKSVYLASPKSVDIEFTRPTLRPEGLLPDLRTGPDDPLSALLAGGFSQQPSATPTSVRFVRAATGPARPNDQLSEIVESHFADPGLATEALLRGEVDVIDRVFPADVSRLRQQSGVRLQAYRVPTIHAVVFNDRESILRSATFRRGLLYAINRQGFVSNELGGNDSSEVARVLSAPLPIGVTKDDPLGYAYRGKIEPRAYDPALGAVLMRLAREKIAQAASAVATKQGTEEPGDVETPSSSDSESGASDASLPQLVLAFPESPIAVAAAGAIASDLQRVGVQVSLRPLEPGTVRPSDRDWDMLYIEAIIEEPFVDLPDLIVGHDLLGRQGGLLWQSVRTLQDAISWDAVRNQFAFVHKLSFDHTPLLPLWQVIEHVAYRDHVTGIGRAPVTLYQHVEAWRLTP